VTRTSVILQGLAPSAQWVEIVDGWTLENSRSGRGGRQHEPDHASTHSRQLSCTGTHPSRSASQESALPELAHGRRNITGEETRCANMNSPGTTATNAARARLHPDVSVRERRFLKGICKPRPFYT